MVFVSGSVEPFVALSDTKISNKMFICNTFIDFWPLIMTIG